MTSDTFSVGEVVVMKKQHPCGENKWKITRYGADVKLLCMKCNRVVMIDRKKFVKNVKRRVNEN